MKLFIAIPAYRGVICPKFIDSLEATGLMLKEYNIDYRVEVLSGNCYIQAARNELVNSFLSSDCDKLLFLDDDISWNPKDVLSLIDSGKDVVCGVYRLKTDYEEYPVIVFADSNGRTTIVNNMMMASRVPTGFLYIDKNVFIKIRESRPDLVYTQNHRPYGSRPPQVMFDFFPQGVKDGYWIGEDYAFCDLWTSTGGEIWVIPDMDIDHHSTDNTYLGNYYKFLMSYTEKTNGANGKA